jgi:folate-binding protein YgfZ
VPTITAPTSDLFVPQAANWDLLGGVSLKKGCDPGQEIVARMQYLGRLKERLYAFRAETEDIAAGTRLFSTALGDDQSCGTVVNAARDTASGSVLLAVVQAAAAAAQDVRLGAADGPLLKSLALPYAVPDSAPAPRAPRIGVFNSLARVRTMCLAVIAVDAHPRYAVVVAANRDEFHARAAHRAHWWNDDAGFALLAGRDLRQGGTWLGVNRLGRWAFVTNVRARAQRPHAPSRGALVPLVLRDGRDAGTAVACIAAQAAAYNGFNLVGGERVSVTFASNRASGARALPRGVSGLSNAGLDTPWPKLLRAKAGVAAWATRGSDELDALFAVLDDRAIADDDALPDTGLTRERERLLSSPFIVSRDYGTRCSTLLALGRDATVHFLERSFNAAGEVTGDVVHRFRIEATQPALG